MNYIIDPMWFYWINVMDAINIISIVGICVSVVFLIIGSIIYFENYGYDEDDRDKKLGANFLKIAIPFLIVFVLVVIFLPTKSTLIEMQIARYATVENAEWTVETVKSAVDYIIEAMKQMK